MDWILETAAGVGGCLSGRVWLKEREKGGGWMGGEGVHALFLLKGNFSTGRLCL